ncbi:MAG: hypothetical protein ABIH11_02730 [Candidatus Altiarchaeota archaeon]
MVDVTLEKDHRELTDRLHKAGYGRRPAMSLARMLKDLGTVKELGEHIDEGALFFMKRGVYASDTAPFLMKNFIEWREGGRTVGELEARESEINSRVCWRPSRFDDVNESLLGFFKRVLGEFEAGHHEWLPSWRNPPSRLAGYYKSRGVKYAGKADLSEFLSRMQSDTPGVGAHDDFIAGIVHDLPTIVSEDDVRRYVRMLENPEGGMTVRTRFPVRFAVLPDESPLEFKGESYFITLMPEDQEVLNRLQKTQYPRLKKNNIPGALSFNSFSVCPGGGWGLQHELQSDHDPRETRGLGIEEWPDLLRQAMHVDMAGMGVKYSIVPKLREAMRSCVGRDVQAHGLRSRMGRAYGSDETPPGGYGGWGDVKPEISDPPSVDYGNYWVRRI